MICENSDVLHQFALIYQKVDFFYQEMKLNTFNSNLEDFARYLHYVAEYVASFKFFIYIM